MAKDWMPEKLWKWDLGNSSSAPLGSHGDVGGIRLKLLTFDSYFPFMCEWQTE